MNTNATVLLLGALGTLLTTLAVAYRGVTGDRFRRKVDESARILSGYVEQIKTLRAEADSRAAAAALEVDRLVRQHREEIADLERRHDAERQRWHQDRDRLEERIDELEAKVAALLYRPASSRSRAEDRKPPATG